MNVPPKHHTAYYLIIFSWAVGSLLFSFNVGYADSKKPLDAVPAEGVTPFDTHGRVPGDPNNGIKDLKRIYQIINIYRNEHDGAYPPDIMSLKLVKNFQKYGFKNLQEAAAFFTNPDTIFADGHNPALAPVTFVYFLSDKRYDGSPVGSPKPLGTRDVLASTNIYQHDNIRNSYVGEDSTINPVGFHLVLWDDGQIEKIAYDQLMYLSKGQGIYRHVFPGQAGVPSNFITYDEQCLKLMGLKTRIRGKPVAGERIQPIPDNGGPESLIALSRLLGQPLDRESMWQVLPLDREKFSLQDIQSGAAKLGLNLQVRQLSWEELQQRGEPALIHLRTPDALATLATIGDDNSIVYEAGIERIVSNEILQRRYLGEAAQLALTDPLVSNVEVVDPVRMIDVPNPEQETPTRVILKNRGKQTLKLQVELPACGCTRTQLSSTELAPGATATLDLALQWRKLTGPTQSDFIVLRTNDPLQPRITLGLELQAANP